MIGHYTSAAGQQIELTGEVIRVDEDTVTVGGKDLGITVKRSNVRLVTSYVAPKRKRLPRKKSPPLMTQSDGLKYTTTRASGPEGE